MHNALTNHYQRKVFIQTKKQARDQAICDMHDRGMQNKKIWPVLWLANPTISVILKKYGRGKTKKRITNVQRKNVVELRKKHMSTIDISNMVWISRGSVSRILIENGMRSWYHKSKGNETNVIWEHIPPRPKRKYIKKHPKRNREKKWFRDWLCKAFK